MVHIPHRAAAPVAAALIALLAALAVLLASPGPAHADPEQARPTAGTTVGPTAKPAGPAATVETPRSTGDGDAGYTCTGGRPDRRCVGRTGDGYGSPSTHPATQPPLTVPSPPAPSVSRSPSPAPELPKTGMRLTMLIVIGVLAIAAGLRLLYVTRRPRA